MPSNRLNSKSGKVLPTSIPVAGWSTIVATLEDATVGADAGPDVGSALAMGVAIESGTDAAPGATVGPGWPVNAGTVAGPEVGVNVANGAEVDVVSTVNAGSEAGRTSVALVTQAKIPITIAAMGKTSSRDIPDYT